MAQEQLGRRNLADYQTKVLDEIEASLTRAFDESRAKLSPIKKDFPGEGFPEEGSLHCFRCECPQFVQRPGGGSSRLSCGRFGCGHSFFSHDVF
ncbi:MAG TPA: hypothetical protein VF744_01690 [Beijerinckiaceae bacterium]|jgi:hypothetical protein